MSDGLIGGIDLRENRERALKINLAVLVWTGVTRGSVEKLHAELCSSSATYLLIAERESRS